MYSHVDREYLALLDRIINLGEDEQDNRTSIPTRFLIGNYLRLPLHSQFPLLTTKKVFWKAAFAEMIGFIRGYDNAADFRALGCNVWNQNANDNKQWLQNSHRKGEDDLGRIYGVQWRDWYRPIGHIDQFNKVIDDLSQDKDDRREIVTAWNPGEIEMMALPPCHMTMIFSLSHNKTRVNLFTLLRSNDVLLGMPFNLAQYGFLLHLVAKMTGKKVGYLHYYANNVHLYSNHLVQARTQMMREPRTEIPTISFHKNKEMNTQSLWKRFVLESPPEEISSFDDWLSINDYHPHPPIKAEMAV